MWFPREPLTSDLNHRLWERIAEDAQRVKCRGMIKRFFTSNVDATKLQGLVQEVSQSIEDFLVRVAVSVSPLNRSLTGT